MNCKIQRVLLIVACTMVGLGSSFAKADFKLENLNKSQFEKVMEDFGTVLSHTSVSPASTWGNPVGFQVGLITGYGSTKDTSELTGMFRYTPMAALFGALSFPYGLGFETNIFPSLKFAKVKFSNYSFAGKWTFTDVAFQEAPLDMAIRLAGNFSAVDFSQTTNGAPMDIAFDGRSLSLDLMGSKQFGVFEPFAGIGWFHGSGELTVNSNVNLTVFQSNFTTGKSADHSYDAFKFFLGSQFNLGAFRPGLEYSNVGEHSRYSLKLAFGF